MDKDCWYIMLLPVIAFFVGVIIGAASNALDNLTKPAPQIIVNMPEQRPPLVNLIRPGKNVE